MDPNAVAALVNLGVSGIGLYLFATGRLIAQTVHESVIALLVARYEEMRADRDEWKRLALAQERRIVEATPVIEKAVDVAKSSIHE